MSKYFKQYRLAFIYGADYKNYVNRNISKRRLKKFNKKLWNDINNSTSIMLKEYSCKTLLTYADLIKS